MPSPEVLCLGGATIDRKYRALGSLVAGSSNPATGSQAFGGVARNVCETLVRLGARAGLASVVGDDEGGRTLTAHLAALGADVSLVETAVGRTAEYIAALDSGGALALGLADMAIFDSLDSAWLARIRPRLDAGAFVFADCNLAAPALAALAEAARSAPFRLVVDPVSVAKAARLPADLAGLDLIVLNRDEAAAVTGISDPEPAMRSLRRRGAAAVVLTDGAGSILVLDGDRPTAVPPRPAKVADVTGAGDALIAAILAGLCAGRGLVEAVQPAARVAALTVESEATVRPDLAPTLLASPRRIIA